MNGDLSMTIFIKTFIWIKMFTCHKENPQCTMPCTLFFFSCIAGLVRDLVGQHLEWACDWEQISMPCTLEALTVIKTFCLWLAVPTYWRIGEIKSQVYCRTTEKQQQKNPTKDKQEPTKRYLETRWEVTLSETKNPQAAQYFSSNSGK